MMGELKDPIGGEHVVEEDLVPANPGLKRRVGLAPLGGEHVEVKDLTGEIVPEPLPQETLGRGGRVEFEARRGDKRAHDDRSPVREARPPRE